MNSKTMPVLSLCLLGFLWLTPAPAALEPGKDTAWQYTLLDGSELIDDCPICAGPTITAAIRGTFNLRLLEANPLFSTYAVENLTFTGGSGSGAEYSVTGSGTLRLGGEVALIQEMTLTARIANGTSTTDARLTSGPVPLQRRLPMLKIEVPQTNGTLLQVYELHLAAAPLREIWFSTGTSFTSGLNTSPGQRISDGDLLSTTGRIVKRNRDLTSQLGLKSPAPDLGLDAVEVLAGGEVAFSTDDSAFSETLGNLQSGDVLSDQGRILRSIQSLLAPFGIQGAVTDPGLDALHLFGPANVDPDEVWFSIEQEQFSERLNRVLRRGDILSSHGQIVRSNQELLARFLPVTPTADYGLDALYVWPSGEIWFSTETGFTGQNSIPYLGGDLLSDQGYVVFRNLELLKSLAPLEDAIEFGLDALWIVTDAIEPAPAPRFTSIEVLAASGNVRLHWTGGGQVFQVQGASKIDGPYQALSPISSDRSFEDQGALLRSRPAGFYRLQQW